MQSITTDMSRMTSFQSNTAMSERSVDSSRFSKAFPPPRDKPPPIPMPYAERTIYVHVKTENELLPFWM